MSDVPAATKTGISLFLGAKIVRIKFVSTSYAYCVCYSAKVHNKAVTTCSSGPTL